MPDRNLNITINTEELKKLSEDIINIADTSIKYTALDLLSETVKEMPVDTGRLQTSVDIGKLEKMSYYIGSNVFYRWWVHEGTGIFGPHGTPITPVNAEFLRFEINGQVFYRRSVKGQKPNRYYDRAIKNTSRKTQRFIDRAVAEYT